MKRYKCAVSLFVFIIFLLSSQFTVENCWGGESTPNVHWVFCIDTSGSMKTKGHMDLLKLITERISGEFLNANNELIKTGDRVTILSFDEKARLEATSLYQTENDLSPVRRKLTDLNKRYGSLTFISEAIVQGIDVVKKYDKFFHTNALYVFTDGKSEPYSPKWSTEKIEARKKRDKENFQKISLAGNDPGLNVWIGILKWEAFEDARSLVGRMGKGGHLIDLTNFSRLSLEKALTDFAQTVRSEVRLQDIKDIDFGTIPYKGSDPYQKSLSFSIHTDKTLESPAITASIKFDPDNPSEIKEEPQLRIQTTEDKMVLSFKMANSNKLDPGTYRGKLRLSPSQTHYGALVIEPSQLEVKFKKSGVVGFYSWRIAVALILGSLFLIYLTNKIRRKMPIRI
jgi:hypothetical protein